MVFFIGFCGVGKSVIINIIIGRDVVEFMSFLWKELIIKKMNKYFVEN